MLSKPPPPPPVPPKNARKTGALNISCLGLSTIPDDVFHLSENLTEGENWWEMMDLHKLDLCRNELTIIPDQIGLLSALVLLNGSFNQISIVSEKLFCLTELKSLDLSHNKIPTVSECIGELKQLNLLNLSYNSIINTITPSICLLNELEVLDLSFNQIKILPNEICLLTKLTKIILSNNLLQSLPPSFSELFLLETIELCHNKLYSLPSFSKMKNLTIINLKENQLNQLSEFPSSNNLQMLYLDFNNLKELNTEMLKNIPNLHTLSIKDNKLSILPSNITSLQELNQLDISNNNITDLPNELGLMYNLQKIIVDGNPIKRIRQNLLLGSCENLKKYLKTRLPPELLEKETDKVEPDEIVYRNAIQNGVIDYQNQKLKIVPDVFREKQVILTATEILLNNNLITEIPDYFQYYNNVQKVMLQYNNIQSFPAILLILPKIEIIDLSYNQLNNYSTINLNVKYPAYDTITSINLTRNFFTNFPLFLYQCKKIRSVELGFNKIQYIEPNGFISLCNIQYLYLNDNHIKEIPKSIICFNKLHTLNVENNDIYNFPYEICFCDIIQNIKLSGNPQRIIRYEYLSKTCEFIKKYIKDRLSEEKINELYELKDKCEIIKSNLGLNTIQQQQQLNNNNNLPSSVHSYQLPQLPPEKDNSEVINKIKEIEEKMYSLQNEIECPGLSSAKVFALKKDLALLRANKIKLERSISKI